MIVGLLTIEAGILDARSLKDKRRVVQGLKQRIRNRFNVSVAEVGYGDHPKRCRLGIAIVSQDSRLIHAQLDRIVEMARSTRDLSLLDYERQML